VTGRSGEPTQAAATVPGEAEGSRGQETTPGDTTKEGERCLCQVEGSH